MKFRVFAGIPRYDVQNKAVANTVIKRLMNTGKIFVLTSVVFLMVAATFMTVDSRGSMGFYFLLVCVIVFLAGYCALMDSVILTMLASGISAISISGQSISVQKGLPVDI